MSKPPVPHILLALLWLAPGCAGRPKTAAALLGPVAPVITSGMSVAEVRQLLGKPMRSQVGSNGKTVEIHGGIWNPEALRISRNSPFPAFRCRTITALYSADGKLERSLIHEGSGTFQRIRVFGQPERLEAGYDVTAADLNQIKLGETTRRELVLRFDEPMAETLSPEGQVVCHWVQLVAEFNFMGTRKDSRSLWVQFNEGGKVKDFGLNNWLGTLSH